MLMVFQAEALSHKLDPYIRNQEGSEGIKAENPSDEEANTAPCNEQMRLWPLIKYVQVTLPASDFVPEGVIFVDIPGMGDSNKKRDEMWKEVTGRWDQCRGVGSPLVLSQGRLQKDQGLVARERSHSRAGSGCVLPLQQWDAPSSPAAYQQSHGMSKLRQPPPGPCLQPPSRHGH